MAQTGFTPILLYSSSTSTNVPLAANLTNSTNGAEIAINIADKNLFFKDSGGVVNTVPIRQSSTSSNGWLSSTDWNTFNGKAPATSGTSILYGNGLGGFNNVTIGTGITFAGGTLSATGSGGTVTSVTGTSPVVSSGGTTPAISLATAYGDTLNPYASKTAKYVLAAPNATAGVPTFRQLANTDITGFGTMSTQNANSVAITGGTLNGVAIGGTTAGDGTFDVLTGNTSRLGIATGTSFVATNGLSSTSTFTGTAPTDGIVIDYSTGYGRFSAFTGDGYQWYTGGIGTTKIMDLSSAGALVTSGTVTANGVLLTGNLGTVTSVTGTSPVVSSGGTTPAISMPAATTSVSGYLTSTDWNTFNNKGSGTVTSVTGTAPVVSSGGATPAISMAAANTTTNGYLTSTDWNTFNGKGSGTVTSVAALTLGTSGTDLSSTVATGTTTPVITLNVPTASATNRGALSAADWTTFNNKGNGTVTSVTGTAPIVSSGGATPAISMAAATTSVNGYLTSTDWTTFNGKQAALVSGTNIKTVGGVSLLGSGDVGTIGVAYGGTGLTSLTAKYIPFGNGTSAFGSSSNFVWDNTNGRLGIGFSSPTAQVEIAGYPNATLKLSDGGSGSYTFSRQAGDGYFHSVDDSGSYGFIWNTSSTEIMRTSGSNLLLGTTSTFASFIGVVSSQNSSGKWCMVAKDAAGNGAAIAFLWSTGSQVGSVATTSVATVYNTTSDYRLKLNAQPLTNSGEFIDSLQPKTWTWEQDGSKGSGFFAHEFQTVSPTSVFGKKDAIDEEGKPVYQSMDASTPEVMANIIAEVQSLRARLKAANIA